MPLSSASKRAIPPLACKIRVMTHATFAAKKGHWVKQCLNKAHFVTKPCSDTAKPNRCSSEPSHCSVWRNSHGNHRHCQEGCGGQRTNKQGWKYNPLTGTESTKIINGHTFNWCSKYMPPWWSMTHLMTMHTDSSIFCLQLQHPTSGL